MTLPGDIRKRIEEKMQQEAARIEKYGHGRPVIVTRWKDQTWVAVGARLFHHAQWRTFQDFLFAYIGDVFEKQWFEREQTKPLADRHPVTQWYQLWFDYRAARRGDGAEDGIIKDDSPPAQIVALLTFLYDLYTLEHNASLRPQLVQRLQVKEQFQGARYEAYVAAAFIRAGFRISYQDESDPASSHVEFDAVHKESGATYSVEAKSRHRPGYLGHPGTPQPLSEIEGDIRKLLAPALRKEAHHSRIVFIDINVPPSGTTLLESDWFNKIGSQFDRIQKTAQGDPLPSAIVFFTNFPYHFVEKSEPSPKSGVFLSGFNMPEFRPEYGDLNVLQNKISGGCGAL